MLRPSLGELLQIAPPAAPPRQPRPHIVLSLVDDLGYADVGWRSPQVKTPYVDSLLRSKAERTVELLRHYTFAKCSPSRAALLTGRLPSHITQVNPKNVRCGLCHADKSQTAPPETGGMDVRMRTLPQLLKSVGYRTALYGKWHLGSMRTGSLPQSRGFDSTFAMLGGFSDHGTHERPDCSHPAINRSKFVDLWDDGRLVHPATHTDTHSCPLFAGRAVAGVEAHDAAQPLFLYMSWTEAHGARRKVCWAPASLQAHGPLVQPPERFVHMADPQRALPEPVRNYRAMVSCVDEGTRNLSFALRRKGMWGNTLMLWASDNGARLEEGKVVLGSNHPFRGGKDTMFEGGVRTVAFLAGGAVPPGAPARFDRPMHVCDWFATFAHVAGMGAEQVVDRDSAEHGLPGVDSIDMWPALVGAERAAPLSSPPQRETILLGTATSKGCRYAALIRGELKVVYNLDGDWPEDGPECLASPTASQRFLLFNLTADPAEERDLSAVSPALTQERERLVALLRRLSHGDHQAPASLPDDWSALECTPLGYSVVADVSASSPTDASSVSLSTPHSTPQPPWATAQPAQLVLVVSTQRGASTAAAEAVGGHPCSVSFNEILHHGRLPAGYDRYVRDGSLATHLGVERLDKAHWLSGALSLRERFCRGRPAEVRAACGDVCIAALKMHLNDYIDVAQHGQTARVWRRATSRLASWRRLLRPPLAPLFYDRLEAVARRLALPKWRICSDL